MEGTNTPSFTTEANNDTYTTMYRSVTSIPRPSYYTICVYGWLPEMEWRMLHTMKYYICPMVSLVGICTNVMSIVILRRYGIRKPSTVLLLGLVIADTMSLLSSLNFAETFEFLGPDYQYPDICGWQYGEGVNYFLLVCCIVFYVLGDWGQCVSVTIPVVITLERFLAVFMPLTFKKFVTTKSACIGVLLCFVFWMPWIIFLMSYFRYYVQLSNVMLFALDPSLNDPSTVFYILNFYVSSVLLSIFPIIVIGGGCILIAFKVKLTLTKRKKMTSCNDNAKWSAKTTRTLLITCLIMFISLLISLFVDYFDTSIPDTLFYFVTEFMRLNISLNASSNFFVYITSNRQLAAIFKDIIRKKKTNHVGRIAHVTS